MEHFPKRVATGIKGFDELVEGGLLEGTQTLVCGSPGTGKSIFCLQFLYHGLIFGDNGLYVTIDEKPEILLEQAKKLGMNLKHFSDENRFRIIKCPMDVANYDLLKVIKQEAESVKAKRLVIDDISIIGVNCDLYRLPIKTSFGSEAPKDRFASATERSKQFIYLYLERLKEYGFTTLIAGDSVNHSGFFTRDTVSEFMCDGIIELKMITMGKTVQRTLEVKKMKTTVVKTGLNSMEITDNGIVAKEFEY
ncbi:MAG TPA: ATPase domain-containing protein [Candidatus Nanoarchaeia archaeon]|nr:ATPase domain-containing protein [Candidatus Nanoarchaeia archaeon]